MKAKALKAQGDLTNQVPVAKAPKPPKAQILETLWTNSRLMLSRK